MSTHKDEIKIIYALKKSAGGILPDREAQSSVLQRYHPLIQKIAERENETVEDIKVRIINAMYDYFKERFKGAKWLIEEGFDLMGKGRYSRAAGKFRRALETNPPNELKALAWLNLGAAMEELGRPLRAMSCFDKAIQTEPTFSVAYYNRGTLKGILGDKEEKLSYYRMAIADFDEALALNPKYQEAYYNRGMAKTNIGDYSGAIADFTSAIKLKPKDFWAYQSRGLAKEFLGSLAGARSDFAKAKELENALP